MNITVLELGEDKVRISLAGQGHTFMNALKTEILTDPTVDVANYVIEFQFSDPVLIVTTHNKADPVKPVLDACRRLSGQCEELLASLEQSVKK
ncbi:MAG TPA: DNA-directed RNA polymerase subunit L [Methanospirillum sp.]|nr:DNA-directed RNA polymerase subunit L [Methanospirillum sp.]